jgi:hypothetical protein
MMIGPVSSVMPGKQLPGRMQVNLTGGQFGTGEEKKKKKKTSAKRKFKALSQSGLGHSPRLAP